MAVLRSDFIFADFPVIADMRGPLSRIHTVIDRLTAQGGSGLDQARDIEVQLATISGALGLINPPDDGAVAQANYAANSPEYQEFERMFEEVSIDIAVDPGKFSQALYQIVYVLGLMGWT